MMQHKQLLRRQRDLGISLTVVVHELDFEHVVSQALDDRANLSAHQAMMGTSASRATTSRFEIDVGAILTSQNVTTSKSWEVLDASHNPRTSYDSRTLGTGPHCRGPSCNPLPRAIQK